MFWGKIYTSVKVGRQRCSPSFRCNQKNLFICSSLASFLSLDELFPKFPMFYEVNLLFSGKPHGIYLWSFVDHPLAMLKLSENPCIRSLPKHSKIGMIEVEQTCHQCVTIHWDAVCTQGARVKFLFILFFLLHWLFWFKDHSHVEEQSIATRMQQIIPFSQWYLL